MNPQRELLKRDISTVCKTVLLFVISIQVLAVVILLLWMMVSLMSAPGPLTNEEMRIIVSRAIAQVNGLAMLIALPVSALWFLGMRGRRFLTSDIRTKAATPRPKTLLKLFALVMAGQMVLVAIRLLLLPFEQSTGISPTQQLQAAQTMTMIGIPGILYVVVVGPCVEEAVFRGAVLRQLLPHGQNFAIVFSALLFGCYHLNLEQGIYAFILGLVLGYTASRFSLKWSLALHMTNNLLSVVVTYAQAWGMVGHVITVCMGLLIVACFLAALFILLCKRGRTALKKQKTKGSAPAIIGVYGITAFNQIVAPPATPLQATLHNVSFWVYIVVTVGGGIALLLL